MRFKTLKPQIKDILKDNPATRGDDFLLVLEVYRNYIPLSMPVKDALHDHKKYNLPSFASIIRVRRKLQVDNPNLVNKKVKGFREDQEEQVLDYVRGLD